MAECSVPGCNHNHHAKGYCKSHYGRIKRGNRAGGPIVKYPKICTMPNCEDKKYAKGYCHLHYYRQYNKRPLNMIKSKKRKITKVRKLRQSTISAQIMFNDPEYRDVVMQRMSNLGFKHITTYMKWLIIADIQESTDSIT